MAAPVTHGTAVGDVTATSAVIWSRTDRDAVMHVQIVAGDDGVDELRVRVSAERDYIGKVCVRKLRPDTEYRYRVWFAGGRRDRAQHEAVQGRFRTAPEADAARAVTFAWGGDLAGQNVCRDAAEGFPVFASINQIPLDFFVGLGDMIYADNACEAVGLYGNAQVAGGFLPAANKAEYWAHWKYNRQDAGYRALLGRVPYYAIWDDHEVVNDFGPLHDTRSQPPYTPGVHLLPLGLDAFLDYNPVAEYAHTPKRLYRRVRWGKHVELYILDTRQYRDANWARDGAERAKSLLGREQLTWLKERLRAADATWKVIVSSVPLSIPTGSPPELGRDGWANHDQATGFEHELIHVLRHMKDHGLRNVVFITTDVHFAAVFRYRPFPENRSFAIHEVVTGPLNAGLFPNRLYDSTLNAERLFFYGPDVPVTSWAQAKPWMNFGLARVDQRGRLTLSVNRIDGAPVYTLVLTPQ